MSKMNPVVHWEMPAEDKSRVSKFYTEAFGWQMQQMGDEYGGYLMAMTTESDQKGPKNPGAINGGFFDKSDKEGYQYPHLIISVDNLEESRQAVEKAGGTILGEAMDIPNVGKYLSFKDTEGNIVGMLQPAGMGS